MHVNCLLGVLPDFYPSPPPLSPSLSPAESTCIQIRTMSGSFCVRVWTWVRIGGSEPSPRQLRFESGLESTLDHPTSPWLNPNDFQFTPLAHPWLIQDHFRFTPPAPWLMPDHFRFILPTPWLIPVHFRFTQPPPWLNPVHFQFTLSPPWLIPDHFRFTPPAGPWLTPDHFRFTPPVPWLIPDHSSPSKSGLNSGLERYISGFYYGINVISSNVYLCRCLF